MTYRIVISLAEMKHILEALDKWKILESNTGNMSNMLQNISPEWRTLFDQQVKQSGEKDKLNSLVQLRNDFAHGGSILVSIETVIKYFDSAVKILNILDNVCT